MKSILPLLMTLTATGAAASTLEVVDLRGEAAEQALTELRTTLKAEPDAFEALRDAGIIEHQLARENPDEARVNTGETYLKQALELRPDDLEAQAWLGSITTMKALFVTDPGKQTFFVKLGTRMMDKAIHQAPDMPVLRLIRGHNSMELPTFLKRTRFAIEDFEHYLALCAEQSCPAHHVAEARTRLEDARVVVAEQQ